MLLLTACFVYVKEQLSDVIHAKTSVILAIGGLRLGGLWFEASLGK
jgi:hypothetical protein